MGAVVLLWHGDVMKFRAWLWTRPCSRQLVSIMSIQVIDGEGNVTGLLNIAKCLYDAIHRLKKKAARTGANESGDADLAASVLQVRSRSFYRPPANRSPGSRGRCSHVIVPMASQMTHLVALFARDLTNGVPVCCNVFVMCRVSCVQLPRNIIPLFAVPRHLVSRNAIRCIVGSWFSRLRAPARAKGRQRSSRPP